MKMDCNTNDDGCGKYALINLRHLNEVCGHPSTFERWTPAVAEALKTLEEVGALQWGQVGTESEFFVLKLRDRHAERALRAYCDSIHPHDPEFAREVEDMALRSGRHNPHCKEPD